MYSSNLPHYFLLFAAPSCWFHSSSQLIVWFFLFSFFSVNQFVSLWFYTRACTPYQWLHHREKCTCPLITINWQNFLINSIYTKKTMETNDSVPTSLQWVDGPSLYKKIIGGCKFKNAVSVTPKIQCFTPLCPFF